MLMCRNCGVEWDDDEVRIERDNETGFTLMYCLNCGSDDLTEIERCSNCGVRFDKEEYLLFGKKKLCAECVRKKFNPELGIDHICHCKPCLDEFVARETKLDEDIITQEVIDCVAQFARDTIYKEWAKPPYEKSDLYNWFEKCIRETCIGEEADLDHFATEVLDKFHG